MYYLFKLSQLGCIRVKGSGINELNEIKRHRDSERKVCSIIITRLVPPSLGTSRNILDF